MKIILIKGWKCKKISKYVTAFDYIDKIKTLVSQALVDMEISHEEFNAIIREKEEYEKMKGNVKNVSEKQENMRFNGVNSRKITSL